MALETYLQKAGSATFVKYFALYEKNKTPAELKEEMRKNDDFAESTMKSKISFGRRIFKEHLEKKALETIIKEAKLEKATLTKAAKLLEKFNAAKAKPSQKPKPAHGKEETKKTAAKPRAQKTAKVKRTA
jgi:hypothetical protein